MSVMLLKQDKPQNRRVTIAKRKGLTLKLLCGIIRSKSRVDVHSKSNFPQSRAQLIGTASLLIKLPGTPQLWKGLALWTSIV